MTTGITTAFYIHWPFCPYKCHFCPFVALASHDRYMEQYHTALQQEIVAYTNQSVLTIAPRTIFFGGGTPSTYPNHLLHELFDTLHKKWDFSAIQEITLEANPGTVTKDQLELWQQLGITRLSIGVQSLNESVLWSLNRLQRVQDVIVLVNSARNFMEKVSVDLILGLPGVSLSEWKALLQTVVTWPIDHISIYFLEVHETTPLYFKVAHGAVVIPKDEETVSTYLWTCEWLEQHGFLQYEISNFARDSAVSLHNSVYWERSSYRGFGVGACSFEYGMRFQNKKNLLDYMRAVESAEEITLFREQLTEEQVALEKIMLGLRTTMGVSWSTLNSLFSLDVLNNIRDKITQFEQQGLVRNEGGRIRLQRKGLVVQNEIVTQLFA